VRFICCLLDLDKRPAPARGGGCWRRDGGDDGVDRLRRLDGEDLERDRIEARDHGSEEAKRADEQPIRVRTAGDLPGAFDHRVCGALALDRGSDRDVPSRVVPSRTEDEERPLRDRAARRRDFELTGGFELTRGFREGWRSDHGPFSLSS
jgi:hypothetical protein